MNNLWQLPEGWRWVKLGEVAYYQMGKTPPRKESENWDNGVIPWITISDMQGFGYVEQTKELISQSAFDKYFKGKLVPKGTLIMSFKLTIGKTSILGVDAVHNEAIISIFPKENLADKYYLLYYLPIVDYSKLLGKAVKGDTLNKSKIYNIPIPLPPLQEQKRIVQKIQEIFSRTKELKREVEEARKEAEALWKSVLFHTFPRPSSELPNGWKWVKLEEVADIRQGKQLSSKEPKEGKQLRPFLRVSNIGWHKIDLSKISYMYVSDKEFEKLRLVKGDVLVCEGGEVGRTAVWEGEIEDCIYQNHIHRVRVDGERLLNYFLSYYMEYATKYLKIAENQASKTAIPNLSGSKLKQFPIPLPPLQEQKRIVQKLEQVHRIVREILREKKQMEEKIELLEKSVLDRAFRGKL